MIHYNPKKILKENILSLISNKVYLVVSENEFTLGG